MKPKLILLASILLLALTSAPAARAQWVQTNGPYEGSDVHDLAVIGTNLFAGTNGGVYLSTDNGASWTLDTMGMGLQYVWSLAVIGSNLFAGTDGSGVFRSTDTGKSWRAARTGLTGGNGLYVPALAVNGTNLFAMTIGDVYLSTDNGTSWRVADTGLPASDHVYAFAVIGTNLFAGTTGTPGNGVYRSTDNGTSWRADTNGMGANAYVTALAAIGTNLFAAAHYDGVYRSTDNGTSWRSVGTGLPANAYVYAFAVIGTNLFAGTYNGLYFSADSGTTWRADTAGLTRASYSVDAFAVIGTNLFAGTAYNTWTAYNGVWRRPLSDFGISDVSQITPIQNSIQSYPNPLSQSTTISFTPQAAGYAEVSIVNMLGVEVARLLTGELGAGEHSFTWDAGKDACTTGMYECLVRMNGQVETLPVVKR